MPQGPFGFTRITGIGPLTSEEQTEIKTETNDNRQIPERAIRSTIIDLDNITHAGLPDVSIPGQSILFTVGGATGMYNAEKDEITLSVELPYAASVNDGFDLYLKAVVAHEYGHKILAQNYNDMEESIKSLSEEGLFNYEEINHTVEYYDFPQEQYVDYDSTQGFIDDVSQYGYGAGARPVEGFCNVLGISYAGMTYDGYEHYHDKIRMDAEEIGDKMMMGEIGDYHVPEEWVISWGGQ